MKQTKISQKREKAINSALSEAFYKVSREYLGDDIENPPDMWNEETKAMYDLLLAFECEASKQIFSAVFLPNKANGAD